MPEGKPYMETISDRTLLETIYQTQIILVGRLEIIQRELNQVKMIVNESDTVYEDINDNKTLYDAISNINAELEILNSVDIDLPFKDVRSR